MNPGELQNILDTFVKNFIFHKVNSLGISGDQGCLYKEIEH